MLRDRGGRMAGDRGRGRGRLPVEWATRAEDAAVYAGRAVVLAASLGLGWLVAAHVDPRGDLMRYSVGLLVGEFR